MASFMSPWGTRLSIHCCFVFLPLCSHCWISWWSHARKLCELAADAGIRQWRGSLSRENGSIKDPTSPTGSLPSRVLFLQFPLSSSAVSLAAVTNTQGVRPETTQVYYRTVLGVEASTGLTGRNSQFGQGCIPEALGENTSLPFCIFKTSSLSCFSVLDHQS